MDFFPVDDSLLSGPAIARFVKNNYALPEPVTAKIIKTGINHTYLLTHGSGRCIFRVYSLHWRSQKEIAEEIKLLLLLKENHIPVSFPLPDAQSVYIQQLQAPEGLRYAVLFSFAEGEKILNFPAALHYQAGQIMGRMHAVTHYLVAERVDYTSGKLLVDSFEQLKQFLPVDTAEMHFMQSLQNHLNAIFSEAPANLRKGIVHLDIWFDNMAIDKDGSITLFDFDFCGNGWLLLDIAYYILQLFSTEKEDAVFIQKKDAFLSGYESVTTISTAERNLLPAAGVSLYFFYLGVQCNRYDNWSNVFLNEIYLKRFINLLVKKWTDYYHLSDTATAAV